MDFQEFFSKVGNLAKEQMIQIFILFPIPEVIWPLISQRSKQRSFYHIATYNNVTPGRRGHTYSELFRSLVKW